MPIHTYVCANPLHRPFDEIFKSASTVPDVLPCPVCSDPAPRRAVYRNRVVGPVWIDLERYDEALLSDRQRMQGHRIRDGRDIARIEQELHDERGYTRLDPHSVAAKHSKEDALDLDSDRTKIAVRDGQGAAMEYDRKLEVQSETDWTNAQYVNWRNANDAVTPVVERDLAAGKLDSLLDSAPAAG